MSSFKKGDKVRRTVYSWGTVKHGQVYEVEKLLNPNSMELVGHSLAFDPRAFELVLYQPAPQAGEADPTGKSAHVPGAKLDAGKIQPRLIIEGMARAIWAVAEVATFGAIKYTPGGWVHVDNGQDRYADAGYRHVLKRAMGETVDHDSELAHLAHEAWNSLAKLDLYIRSKEQT